MWQPAVPTLTGIFFNESSQGGGGGKMKKVKCMGGKPPVKS